MLSEDNKDVRKIEWTNKEVGRFSSLHDRTFLKLDSQPARRSTSSIPSNSSLQSLSHIL